MLRCSSSIGGGTLMLNKKYEGMETVSMALGGQLMAFD